MIKIFVMIFVLIFASNPILVFANENNSSKDLVIQNVGDYYDKRNLTMSYAPNHYIKQFKITNNTDKTLIIQKIETIKGFDNNKGYGELRTPYSGFFMEASVLCTMSFGLALISYIPYTIALPINNSIKRQKYLSINKYQTGKYRLKPHKNIIITIVPTNWKPELDDELIVYYKKTEPSSEVETFRHQFKYPATNQIKSY